MKLIQSPNASESAGHKQPLINRASLGTAAFIAGLCISPNAVAQSTGNSTTRVLTPITVTNINDLNFGRIIPGSATSIIRLRRNTGASRIMRGDALPIGGTVERAEFVIAADASTNVQITLPNSVNLVRSGGTEVMRVNRFRLNGGGGRTVNRSIDNNGLLSVLVSAQLRIFPAQAAGVYRGNYDVTVEYN